ncbi:hypothetical protein TNCV_397881 [Trichonephila clavipes]|nr:hypothetical protein TNCV_397881 [Trichonephila clavipes]
MLLEITGQVFNIIICYKTENRPDGRVVSDANGCAWECLGSTPRESMDFCKCIEPVRRGNTNYLSRRKSSRKVVGRERGMGVPKKLPKSSCQFPTVQNDEMRR